MAQTETYNLNQYISWWPSIHFCLEVWRTRPHLPWLVDHWIGIASKHFISLSHIVKITRRKITFLNLPNKMYFSGSKKNTVKLSCGSSSIRKRQTKVKNKYAATNWGGSIECQNISDGRNATLKKLMETHQTISNEDATNKERPNRNLERLTNVSVIWKMR